MEYCQAIRFGGELKPDKREQSQTTALCANHRMTMKMYVGSLSYDTTENALRDLFAQYGEVTEVAIPTDRETGQSRGFGFVTMSSRAEMTAAIEALDGKQFEGRNLRVNEARAREERGGGFRR